MLPAKQIALWADKLRDISATSLLFPSNIYDRERSEKIQEIAMNMLAFATGTTITNLKPLQENFFSRPTPLVSGDAAVIDSSGCILLIQRSDNKMWAMPGGFLEVGESPSIGVLREVLEETGVVCKARSLIGVFDSLYSGSSHPLQIFQLVFLCEPISNEDIVTPSHKHETLKIKWFSEQSLPSNIDPSHVSRIPEAFRVWRGDFRPYFD
jgi:ADP-ribose pyrophosphatase YjhB (NUDIX family)